MKVSREGNRRIMINVMIGLKGRNVGGFHKRLVERAYEYHSHAEYSVLSNKESVLRPECVVFETAIMDDN